MLDNFDMIDKIARKVMGFSEDEIIDYDEAIQHYVFLLSYYGTLLLDEEFLNLDNFDTLNYSFNHCTGWVLEDYLDVDNLDICNASKKVEENAHYSAILTAASKIVERFDNFGLSELASTYAASFYVIGNAVYEFENDLENINVKKYS